MKKTIICLFFCVVMVLATATVSAFADTTPEIGPAPVIYNLWVDGTQVSTANQDNICGDLGSASYDPDTNTLTLNGYGGGPITSRSALNIELKDGSANIIYVPGNANGITIDEGDCTFSGSGDLGISVENSRFDGIYLGDGDLYGTFGGNLEISAGDDCIYLGEGSVSLVVEGNADLESAYGLYIHGDIDVEFKGDVSIDCDYYGIFSYGDIDVAIDGDVEISAGDDAIHAYGGVSAVFGGDTVIDVEYDCICAEDGDIDAEFGGETTITAGDDGIYTEDGDISVSFGGDTVIEAYDYGIYTEYGDVSVSFADKAEVNAYYYAFGANYGNTKVVANGDLTINAPDDYCVYGYYNVEIGGTGAVVMDGYYPIWTYYGDVILSGSAPVTITAYQNPIWLYDYNDAGNSLLLNGTGAPITLVSTDGEAAVINCSSDTSPVGGTNLDYYDLVTGSPDSSSVVYDHNSTFNVSVTAPKHGSVEAAPDKAAAGETVKLTVTPDDGYELDTLTVVDKNKAPISVAVNGTFTMPSSDVSVSASFAAVEYTITYKTNGAVKNSNPKTYTVEDTIVLNDPVKPAALFLGWTCDKLGGGIKLIPQGTTGNLVIESRWAPISSFADDVIKSDPKTPSSAGDPVVIPTVKDPETVEPEIREFPFDDVPADLYADAAYVFENGLMIGVSDTKFAPDVSLSRAMIVTILYRLEGEPAFMNDNVFTDVEEGSWYEKAVVWANGQGIVLGYGNDKFGPSDPVTREQFATIMYRYAQYKGCDVSLDENVNFLSYADVFDLDDYAKAPMFWALDNELIDDVDGALLPTEDATRAVVAAFLHRFCETFA